MRKIKQALLSRQAELMMIPTGFVVALLSVTKLKGPAVVAVFLLGVGLMAFGVEAEESRSSQLRDKEEQ